MKLLGSLFIITMFSLTSCAHSHKSCESKKSCDTKKSCHSKKAEKKSCDLKKKKSCCS